MNKKRFKPYKGSVSNKDSITIPFKPKCFKPYKGSVSN